MTQPWYEAALKETRTWLFDHKARLLDDGAAAMPRSLRRRVGQAHLLPVGWKCSPEIVLFLRPAFPDVEPLVFLPGDAPSSRLIPHVNRSGQVCCLPPESAVNPFKPVEILETVLNTARNILEREYSPEELLREILPELQAYWHPSDTPCWLLQPSLAMSHQLVHVRALPRPTPEGVAHLAALDGSLEKHATTAVVLEVARDQVAAFVHDPVPTLWGMPDWRAGLNRLGEFAANHHGKRIRAAVLAGYRLPEGMVWMGGYFDQQLKLGRHGHREFAQTAQSFLMPERFVRCNVQDISTCRLLRRTAGNDAMGREETKLALIGCGALGGFVVDVLARHGFGQLLCVDKEDLHPANLARHVLGWPWLFRNKAEGIADRVRSHAPNTLVGFEPDDFRSPNTWKRLVEFEAAVTIMATGDINAELTLSRVCAAGEIGACVFTWLEPNLSGAHLIYQPRGGPTIEALHEADASGKLRYRHRILEKPEEFIRREAGCQTAFTPFAGADVALFSALAARKILAWLSAPPDRLTVLRWKPETGWEELP